MLILLPDVSSVMNGKWNIWNSSHDPAVPICDPCSLLHTTWNKPACKVSKMCCACAKTWNEYSSSRLFPLLFPIQRFILGVLVNLTEVFHLWEIITGLCRSLVHGSLSHFSFCLFSTTRALLSSDFISPVRGVRFLPEKNTKGGFIHMDINFTLRYETGAKIGWL